MIRRIADAGFEIASHSHSHLGMDSNHRHACEQDITRSKHLLEDISGREVVGYRSPTWTANLADDWLWDHLAGLGFRYDSSLFPFKTHLYGSFDNPVAPFRLRSGLWEIPPSVATFGSLRLPYGGGFYLRLYPLWVTRWLLGRDFRRGRLPIVYLHPWELDGHLDDAIEAGWLNHFIGNYRVRQTWNYLEELVARYPTATMADHCALMGS